MSGELYTKHMYMYMYMYMGSQVKIGQMSHINISTPLVNTLLVYLLTTGTAYVSYTCYASSQLNISTPLVNTLLVYLSINIITGTAYVSYTYYGSS